MENTTISVSKHVKKKLERLRGDKTWNEFLLELMEKVDRERKKESARKFVERYKLNDEEAAKLKELTQKRREEWTFDTPKDLNL